MHKLMCRFVTTTKKKQDASNGISTGCLMRPHLFPLYASQIFKAILPSQLKQDAPNGITRDAKCGLFYSHCVLRRFLKLSNKTANS